jgi:hypothetical protein
MARTPVRWIFHDPILDVNWTLPVNPNDGGSPPFQKTLAYVSPTAPDGKTIIFEGAEAVQALEFSGVLLSQEHYDGFVTWYRKRHQIRITDDLGRQFWVYIESFTPKRKRSATIAWKHDYTMRAVILEWA